MAPALEVADIFRRHGEAFRQAHAGHLGCVERRIMGAITACRTAALGGHVEQCDDCGTTRIAYNSCRNRHCPKCQGLARVQWLAERQAELLPVPYFHVVFTLPAPVGEIAFQNKAAVYAILLRTAAETLTTIAADPRHLGAKLGMTMVLHTWGQTLQHHPHVHCVVPGGGPSFDGTRWVACRTGFFLPVRVLSRLFRRLFLRELGRRVSPESRARDWISATRSWRRSTTGATSDRSARSHSTSTLPMTGRRTARHSASGAPSGIGAASEPSPSTRRSFRIMAISSSISVIQRGATTKTIPQPPRASTDERCADIAGFGHFGERSPS